MIKHNFSDIEANISTEGTGLYDEDFILFFPDTKFNIEIKRLLSSMSISSYFSHDIVTEEIPKGLLPSKEEHNLDQATQNKYQEMLYMFSKANEKYNSFFLTLKKIIGNITLYNTLSYNTTSSFIYEEVLPVIKKNPQIFLAIGEFYFHEDSDYCNLINFFLQNLLFSLALLDLDKSRTYISIEKKVQVSITCMCSNIGMISVLEKIQSENIFSSLYSPQLNKIIPKFSYSILKQSSFPFSIIQAVLESRSRYEAKEKDQSKSFTTMATSGIGRFVFIINVYLYLSKKRGSVNALKQVVSRIAKEFDPNYIRLLVKVIGKVPPGSYVELKNKARGMLLVSEVENTSAPILQLITNPNGKLIAHPTVISLNSPDFAVVRELDSDEREELQKYRSRLLLHDLQN